MSLTPDDEPRETVNLARPKAPAPPYGVAAVLIGLAMLLVGRMLTRGEMHWSFPLLLAGFAAIPVAYLTLTRRRARLNLIGLCALAAILGYLLSTPAYQVFVLAFKDASAALTLCLGAGTAGIFGAFTAWALGVEQAPELVISINFLSMFVVVSLINFVSGLLALLP